MPGFILTALTRDPVLARAADLAGVDRIGVDVERLGKVERQRGKPGLRLSDHELQDLAAIAAQLRHARAFARLNPLHDGTRAEIELAIELGARVLMLPYFTDPQQAASFVEMVDGRAEPVLLVETAEAARSIRQIVSIPGVHEIMLGLNDLHLSLGLPHAFAVFTSGAADRIGRPVLDAGLRFGFGGIARPGQALPIPPDLIYAQYPLLAASAAWLSRSFYEGLDLSEFGEAVRAARQRIDFWATQPRAVLEGQRAKLSALCNA